MKQLLCGEKEALQTKDLIPIVLPNWPELKMEVIMGLVKDDQDLARYLKDDYWKESKPHSKPFLCNIVNSLLPGFLTGLVSECSQVRNTPAGEAK